jgi:hypothetical protein
MKKLSIAAAIALALVGCSSMPGKQNTGITPPADATAPIKETKISTTFTDEGVKIVYTTLGKLERIEVTGQAPAWKRNVNILAEGDAMDKLVKFVHGKNVSSERRVKIMSKAIDNASDVTVNKFKSNDGTFDTTDKELEADINNNRNNEASQKDNTAKRNARVVDQTVTEAVTEITSKGFLHGVRKIGESIKDDGKTYVAVYQWSEQDANIAAQVRDSMRKNQR